MQPHLVAALLLASAFLAPVCAAPDAPTKTVTKAKALKALKAHFGAAAKKPQEAGRLWEQVAGLKPRALKKWRRDLWKLYSRGQLRRAAAHAQDPAALTAELAGVSMRYTVKGAARRGQKVPLFIYLHGGGTNKGRNDTQWTLAQAKHAVDGLYLCPRAPEDLAESWRPDYVPALLQQIVREAIATRSVNSNRVYLAGFSMGGWGAMHIAPVTADTWASAAANAGGGFPQRSPPENLRNTPFMIQIGSNDTEYRRNALSRAFSDAIKSLHAKDPSGYTHKYIEHAGKAHKIETRDTPAWLQQFTRDPIPARIAFRQPAAPQRQNFYWLRIEQPAAGQTILATREGNLIRLETSGVSRLRIRVDERMLDLANPVQVFVGGSKVFDALVPAQLSVMVDTLEERGDPELMFCGEIVLDL